MANCSRHIAVLMAALIGATVLLLVGFATQVWAVPAEEEEGAATASEKPQLPQEKVQKIRDNQAKLEARQKLEGPPESRIDEDPAGNPVVAGELIVTYKEQPSSQETTTKDTEDKKKEAKQKVGAQTKIDLSEINAESVSFPEVKNESSQETRQEALERKKQELEVDPDVKSVEYNHVSKLMSVTNDPLVDQQWGLPLIRAPQAWSTSKGAGAIIAVIDSGIQNTHPDIGKIAHEWDFFHNDSDAEEDMGHATHVAGTAAAMTNNATGIAGVAPDASLFDYKSCGGILCLTDATNAAIIQAADNGADVINLSQGNNVSSSTGEAAVDYAWNKGVVVVASAGNDARDGDPPSYPGAYPNAIAVGSVDKSNVWSWFSTYGDYVDVAAPGGKGISTASDPTQDILSTVPSSVCLFCRWWRNHTTPVDYEAWSGTSMAAPHVAGLAALLAAQGLSAGEIRSRIESTATDLGPAGQDVYYGKGLINAHAAVTNDTAPKIVSVVPAPDTSTTDTTPTIKAIITDAQTKTLPKDGISLYVDATKVDNATFALSSKRGKNTLSYTPTLEAGSHQVRLVATDPQGMKTSKTWYFTVS